MTFPWAYLDSSTFLKLYVKEKGSRNARSLVRRHRILSCSVLPIECLSALSRKRRAAEIGQKDFKLLVQRIRTDYANLEAVQLGDEVLKKAEEVALQGVSGALDFIHIGAASIFQDETGIDLLFFTSDKRQFEAAIHFGLNAFYIG